MSETLIFKDGGDCGGVTGVHSTVCLSFESDMVPSCFLYKAEALSGGFDMITSLEGWDVDERLQVRPGKLFNSHRDPRFQAHISSSGNIT